jgi:hypothetical protein
MAVAMARVMAQVTAGAGEMEVVVALYVASALATSSVTPTEMAGATARASFRRRKHECVGAQAH